MVTYAAIEDVEDDLGRKVTDQAYRVAALIDRAEARIKQVDPNIDQRVQDGRLAFDLVQQVECEMVVGVLRNENAWQSETESMGPFSKTRTINVAVASGLLELTNRQRDILGIRSRAGSVAPKIGYAASEFTGYPPFGLTPASPPW